MLAKVFSGATVALNSVLVTVEVDISEKSLPSFTKVGTQSPGSKYTPFYS